MRLLNYRSWDGRERVRWSAVLVAVVLVPAAIISAVELLWYVMTGGVSPLMGGFGLVAALLVLVRLIGEALHNTRYRGQTIF